MTELMPTSTHLDCSNPGKSEMKLIPAKRARGTGFQILHRVFESSKRLCITEPDGEAIEMELMILSRLRSNDQNELTVTCDLRLVVKK